MADLYELGVSLLTEPKHTKWIAPLLIIAEAVLCAAIVVKVPYTEIDWETYMAQVSKFLPPNYETDYRKLDGPTGPCVYPALHVYIHSALYYLVDEGRDVEFAQIIYAGLYLCTLALVFASYRRVDAPPWLLAPLVLSKRMHSIFLLRLFNDCWAAFFFWLAVYCATRKSFGAMTMAWTAGLGVKMTMLLPFPALIAILVQGAGMELSVMWMFISWVITFGIAAPFMGREETFIYLKQAFDLGRQFLYKWTVNWKFVSEEIFLSKEFKYALLALHVGLLLAFLHYKWVRPSSRGIGDFVTKHFDYISIDDEEQAEITSRMIPQFVMDALLGSIVIGMLCARSLHYQFYSYLGWATPYILWRNSRRPVLVLVTWALQEYSWLKYPADAKSSATVVLLLALQVYCTWGSSSDTHTSTTKAEREKKKQ